MISDINPRNRHLIGDEHYCPVCGYDLIGNLRSESHRCPECGRPFDPWGLARQTPQRRWPEWIIRGTIWFPPLLAGAAAYPKFPPALLELVIWVVCPVYSYGAVVCEFRRREIEYAWGFAVLPGVMLWFWAALWSLAAAITVQIIVAWDLSSLLLLLGIEPAPRWFIAAMVVGSWLVGASQAFRVWNRVPGSWLNWGDPLPSWMDRSSGPTSILTDSAASDGDGLGLAGRSADSRLIR